MKVERCLLRQYSTLSSWSTSLIKSGSGSNTRGPAASSWSPASRRASSRRWLISLRAGTKITPTLGSSPGRRSTRSRQWMMMSQHCSRSSFGRKRGPTTTMRTTCIRAKRLTRFASWSSEKSCTPCCWTAFSRKSTDKSLRRRININAKFNDKTSPYEPILVNGYYGNDFRED